MQIANRINDNVVDIIFNTIANMIHPMSEADKVIFLNEVRAKAGIMLGDIEEEMKHKLLNPIKKATH